MKTLSKRILTVALTMAMLLALVACGGNAPAPVSAQSGSGATTPAGFDAIAAEAKGTTVNFYTWGGDERINKWIDTEVSTYVKSNYDVTLNRVPVDDTQTIIAKMLSEKQSNVTNGSVDMLWVNGENFYTAKENKLLYGPFTQDLPNFNDFVDAKSDLINYDFGVSVDGLEAPYGKAIFVFINDSAVTPEAPKNTQEFLDFAKKYPGKVTYPAPPDFTGSVFVRQIIYDIVGYDAVKAAGADKEKLRTAVKPAIDYLNELKPYLWNEGKSYPASSGQLENMFADGETVFSMSYDPNTVSGLIADGILPATARDFAFEKGMISNISFLAIPSNASNVAGAQAVINAILSPELQASKADPANWGSLPILDYSKLDAAGKKLFDSIPVGQGALSETELAATLQPELPANVVPLLEEIWLEEVARS